MTTKQSAAHALLLAAITGCGHAGDAPEAALPGQTDAPSPTATQETPAGGAAQTTAASPLYELWDGPSGATANSWNAALLVPWANQSGDWTDADGAPQGQRAFATSPVDAKVPAVLDLTSLVQDWMTHGNTGLMLVAGAGEFSFASRESETPPLLHVATDAGEWDAPCKADTQLDASTISSLGGRASFRVSRSVHAAVQFDLSQVKGNVQAARLTLTPLSVSSGKPLVGAYRLLPPRVLADEATSPELGLASAVDYDKGLANHPDVLYAGDFAEGYERFFSKSFENPETYQAEPELQSTSVRGFFGQERLGSCGSSHRFSSAKETEPEELYFRYYVMLEEDWGSPVDGNKMPGLAGRYGDWTGKYWNPACGNGGSRTTGLVSQSGVRCGWSMRGHIHVPHPTDANPYAGYSPLGTYAYHVDQAGDTGDAWRWGTKAAGYPVLKHGRWYSIEQYVKVNSIVGPFDSLGNGVGQKDGILRVWVNGVRVFEKTDLRVRQNALIKIDDVWLNWYHGGTEPTPPGGTYHYRMSNTVVARKYIGPMKPR